MHVSLRLVRICHILPPLPRCFLLCFNKVGYGITFVFVFGRVNEKSKSQLRRTHSSAVTGKKSLLQIQASTVCIAHLPGRGYGLCLPHLIHA